MKTGLGIYRRIRRLYSYFNLFRFNVRKKMIGFDVANQFIQRVDKYSVQLILKRNGATIGKDCDIETGLIFHNCKDYSNLIIGDNCHIGKNCFFDLRDKTIIGNNVTISMQCTFITHQDMGKSKLNKLYGKLQDSIVIEDNAYIGVKSTVLKGLTIKKNSIVAACSLVIANVNTNSVFGGIPAIEIKKINGA